MVVLIITSAKEGVRRGSVKSDDVHRERKTGWRVVLNKHRTFGSLRPSTSPDTNICSFGLKLCWAEPVVVMCRVLSLFLLVLLACPQILALTLKCHPS